MDSEQAYELIMQGKAELAVVTLAPDSEGSVIETAVWDDPLDFMVAPAHPLAAEKRLDLATLAYGTFVGGSSGDVGEAFALGALRAAATARRLGSAMSPTIRSTSFNARESELSRT